MLAPRLQYRHHHHHHPMMAICFTVPFIHIKAVTTKEKDFINAPIAKRALPSQVHCNPTFIHTQARSHSYAICELLLPWERLIGDQITYSYYCSLALDAIEVLLLLVIYDDILRCMSQKQTTQHGCLHKNGLCGFIA